MFTGLVEDVGTVARADRRSDALVLAIRPQRIRLGELTVGESICHDGACLTVTELGRETYAVLAGAETLARTTLGGLRAGTRVNLERALRVGDRLGGHWVTGHIDGTGELGARRDLGANLVLVVRAAPALLRYVVEKGSIAVAGVSLTVNAVDPEGFSVAIIPHTRDHTTLGALAVGDRVNLEVDILAKHVEKLYGAGLHRTDGSGGEP
ncbi:MAG TPA: riboflavin synthase [Kofleriaceae bacterium]|nr:riboflavin synthase [Kofleriaceae bacterium]